MVQNPHSKMAILWSKWAKSRVFLQDTVGAEIAISSVVLKIFGDLMIEF